MANPRSSLVPRPPPRDDTCARILEQIENSDLLCHLGYFPMTDIPGLLAACMGDWKQEEPKLIVTINGRKIKKQGEEGEASSCPIFDNISTIKIEYTDDDGNNYTLQWLARAAPLFHTSASVATVSHRTTEGCWIIHTISPDVWEDFNKRSNEEGVKYQLLRVSGAQYRRLPPASEIGFQMAAQWDETTTTSYIGRYYWPDKRTTAAATARETEYQMMIEWAEETTNVAEWDEVTKYIWEEVTKYIGKLCGPDIRRTPATTTREEGEEEPTPTGAKRARR